ncbi:MAG: hypothetical protein ACJAZX_000859 [Rickettsiales bacterium]|jgi:hypothetical protein
MSHNDPPAFVIKISLSLNGLNSWFFKKNNLKKQLILQHFSKKSLKNNEIQIHN